MAAGEHAPTWRGSASAGPDPGQPAKKIPEFGNAEISSGAIAAVAVASWEQQGAMVSAVRYPALISLQIRPERRNSRRGFRPNPSRPNEPVDGEGGN